MTHENTFVVDSHDGENATVTSETGGTYTMPKNAVTHFADDLNSRVTVPEHPTHQGINAIRQGAAKFLGKGNDGMVFDTGDGNVAKVTTVVPYNLSYFRDPEHAITDARKKAELTNQAISEGHDVLLPQEFMQHGEKGFTIMPKVTQGTALSREQIMEYREKLHALTDAGYRLNDTIQHGVDADGRIRIFDTGALEKIEPGAGETAYGEEQREHADTLLREHGHFDDVQAEDTLRDLLRRMQTGSPSSFLDAATQWQEMVENGHDALPFLIDEARQALEPHQGNDMAEAFENLLADYESTEANRLLDERMLEAQQLFKGLLDDEYDGQSIDDYIVDTELFARAVADLEPDEIADLAYEALQAEGQPSFSIANVLGFDVMLDDNLQKYLDWQIEKLGINEDGEEVAPGTLLSDGSPYEPQDEPDMDEYMRNQYPEGYSWYESGFLMQDGTLLDMSHGSGERADDHRTITPSDVAAKRWGWDIDGSQWSLLQNTMQRSGAFRIDGQAGLLHMETEPTAEQERAIADFINEYNPEYLAISFQGKDWSVDYPNAGQVLRQIEKIAQGETPYTGEFTDDHVNDFNAWLEEAYENGDVDDYEEIDWEDGQEKYITADGRNARTLAESYVGFLDILEAMNPAVHIEDDTVSIMGTPTKKQLMNISEWVDEALLKEMNLVIYSPKGNVIFDEQIGDDEWLDGQDVADQIDKALKIRVLQTENRDANLKRWAKGSKLVNDDGSPLVLYHGSQRPDRIGELFQKDRATSGPMPFFTTNPEVASGYAANKADTSLDYDETELYDRFTIDGRPLLDAWNYLSSQDRQALSENLHKVYFNDETGKYELDETGELNPLSEKLLKENADNPRWMNYQDKQVGRGNLLASMYDYWMHGGMLHPHTEYGDIRRILNAAGIGLSRTEYDDPYASYGAVFPVYIRMQNPLRSDSVPREVADAITEAAEQAAIGWEDQAESDIWDKNAREPREWAELFEQATQHTKYKQDNSYIWTSIPDFASDVFRKMGYDGIIDIGNKGGSGLAHEVVIPFEENQIKSAIGNTGAFDEDDIRMTYAAFDDDESPAKPTGTYPSRTGASQLMEGSDEGDRRNYEFSKSQMRSQVLVEPDDIEPYEHVEPEQPKAPEPNQQSLETLKSHYKKVMGVDATETSGIKSILQRNKQMVMKNPDWDAFAPVESEYLKNLQDEELDRLHDEAHPKAQKINAWENDDYYYHIAPSDNAELISEEGLKSNLESNFPSIQGNIKGNVFFTEKSGVPEWSRLIGARSYNRMQDSYDNQLRRLQRSLQIYTDSEDEESAALAKQRIAEMENRINELNNADEDHIKSGVVKVFRVPKSKIQDYVAADEIGTEDAKAPAFKLNEFTRNQVRRAKEMVGVVERENAEANDALEALYAKRKISVEQSEAKREALRTKIGDFQEWYQNTALPENYTRVPEEIKNPFGFNYEKTIDYDDETKQFVNVYALYFQDVTKDESGNLQRKDELVGETFLTDEEEAQALNGDINESGQNDYIIARLRNKLQVVMSEDVPLSDREAFREWFDEQSADYKNSSKQIRWVALLRDTERFISTMRQAIAGFDANEFFSEDDARRSLSNSWEDLQDTLVTQDPLISRFGAKLWDVYKDAQSYIDAAERDRNEEQTLEPEKQKLLSQVARGQLQDMKLKAASNPNYWRWAKNTKAVDSNGLPIILFHGTQKGGFDKFGNMDVAGHVYSTTDVSMASSYAGQYTDDITPALVTSVDDIKKTIANTKRYALDVEYSDDIENEPGKIIRYEFIEGVSSGAHTLFTAESEEELVVRFNNWLFNQKDPLQNFAQSGVYPLLYRLQKPAVIYGHGANWNSIPVIDELEHTDDLAEVIEGIVLDYAHAHLSGGIQRLREERARTRALNIEATIEIEKYLRDIGYQYPGLSEEVERMTDQIEGSEEFDPYAFQEVFELIAEQTGVTVSEAFIKSLGLKETLRTRQWAAIAQNAGYDGIVFQKITDYGGSPDDYESYRPADVYVAFSTDQVKSAHNFGQFGERSDSQRLLYQAAEY